MTDCDLFESKEVVRSSRFQGGNVDCNMHSVAKLKNAFSSSPAAISSLRFVSWSVRQSLDHTKAP